MKDGCYIRRGIVIYVSCLMVLLLTSGVLVFQLIFSPAPFEEVGYEALALASSGSMTAEFINYQMHIGPVFLSAMVFSSIIVWIIHLSGRGVSIFCMVFLSGALAIVRYALDILPIFGLFNSLPEQLRPRVFLILALSISAACLISGLCFCNALLPGIAKGKMIRILTGVMAGTTVVSLALYETPAWYPALFFCFGAAMWLTVYFVYCVIIGLSEGRKYSLLGGLSGLFLAFGLISDALCLAGYVPADLRVVFPVCILAYFVSFSFMLAVQERDMIKSLQETSDIRKITSDNELALLTNQIQPHFIYNTLSSIRTLIKKSPDEAYNMVYDFSKYLRANIDSIGQTKLISFGQELDNIRAYLNVELVRFARRLKIEWDIKTVDFLLPPLSIQPLVENAVKHGVCRKTEGGTVTIRTFELEDCFVVEIVDDGVGFDVPAYMSASTPSGSVGIKNVRIRLEKTLRATLWIESELGKGTLTVIRFPKETQERHTD